MKKIFKLPARPEDEVEGGLLLDVVVGQSPAILQLLACTDDKVTLFHPRQGINRERAQQIITAG